jgi:hypothetical protein
MLGRDAWRPAPEEKDSHAEHEKPEPTQGEGKGCALALGGEVDDRWPGEDTLGRGRNGREH